MELIRGLALVYEKWWSDLVLIHKVQVL